MAALEGCQTQALRRVAGAYRAVHHQVLKKELAIPSLEAYYNRLLLRAEERWEKKAWCDYTEATVQQAHTGSTRDVGESTSLSLRRRWARKTLESYTPLEYSTQQAEKEWREYQRKTISRAPAYEGEWSHANIKRYAGLTSAQTSIAFQVRTEKIGLRSFLFDRKVPDIASPICQCMQGRQTAKHLLIFCPRYPKDSLRDEGGTLDYNALTGNFKGLRKVAKWFLRNNILDQFRVARDLAQANES